MLKLWSDADPKVFNKVVGKLVQGEPIEAHRIKLDGKLPTLKKGEVCLGFGVTALEVLQKAGLAAKNRGLGSLRETVIPHGEGKFLLTFSPGIVLNDYARKPEIEWDVRLAMRLEKTGSMEAELGDYSYVDDFTKVVDYVKAQYKKTGKPVPISADLETVGLYPHVPDVRIVSLSITCRKGHADVLWFEKTDLLSDKQRAQIKWLFNTKKAITRGANFKFDKGWIMERWGIECTNDKFDSLLVGSLLDENRDNSLNMHAKTYTVMGGYDDPLNKKYDKSRMDLVPSDDLLPYAGGDTDACYRTSNVLRKNLIKDKRLTNLYVNLVQPAAQVFAKVEHRGMVVDRQEYNKLRTDVSAELERLEGEAFAMMPRRIRHKYSDNLALTRDVILREFLFTGRGLNLKPEIFTPKPDKDGNLRPSCSLDHLKLFSDNPDAAQFIEVMKAYGSAKKTLGTYIDGFLKHLRADGKFHPTYILHRGTYGGDDKESGAVTGRTSCKDPALQTIPKHTIWTKPLRSVYAPPPGMVILQADYSQGELRVVACVADEPTMIGAYKKGIDLHSITAAKLAGYTFENFMKLPEAERDEYRFGGKAGNFGLLYGMGWVGFQAYAQNQFGVSLTDQEAQDFRDGFFELYAGLVDWHKETKAFARLNGFVRSPLGRVRHLPLIGTHNSEVRSQAERQSINSPIQSTLSDLCMLAMVHLDRLYPDLWIFGMTHDSIAMYVPEDAVDVWAMRVRDVMENLPLKDFFWKPKLAFPADVEIGVKNLAELQKYKFAA